MRERRGALLARDAGRSSRPRPGLVDRHDPRHRHQPASDREGSPGPVRPVVVPRGPAGDGAEVLPARGRGTRARGADPGDGHVPLPEPRRGRLPLAPDQHRRDGSDPVSQRPHLLPRGDDRQDRRAPRPVPRVGRMAARRPRRALPRDRGPVVRGRALPGHDRVPPPRSGRRRAGRPRRGARLARRRRPARRRAGASTDTRRRGRDRAGRTGRDARRRPAPSGGSGPFRPPPSRRRRPATGPTPSRRIGRPRTSRAGWTSTRPSTGSASPSPAIRCSPRPITSTR